MAVIHACDRCGTAGALPPVGKFERIGLVKGRDYCPDCAEAMRAFLTDLDVLHTKVAEAFKAGLERLRQTHLKAFPGMTFPDA